VAPPASIAAGDFSPTETSAEVLRLYVAEDDAGALRTVQAGLERCDAASRRTCPDTGKALLLRDLGIVQAGAYRDHAAAVTAFKDALRLDPNTSIPPDLLVDRVREAFVEAGGKIDAGSRTVAAPAVAAASAESPADQAQPEEKKSRYEAGDVFVLVTGTWGGSNWNGTVAAEGGAVLAGLWHVVGPLTVGPRVTFGGTIATDDSFGNQFGPYGFVGMSAAVGLLPRGKRNTGFFLFTFGPDYFPELGRARTVGTFTAGASIGGFALGGGPAFILDQERTSGGMWLVVGWGNYVKD